MEVPFVDLQANFERHQDQFESTVQEIISSGWYIGGEPVETFERELAEYIGVDHAVGVGSGTDAIRLSLEALGIDSGSEVLTVSHTFVSSVDGIVHNDARPTFVDIEPETYTINPEELAAAVTDRTEAILPVHLYGQPVDVEAVLEVAEAHDLKVIEDACQAHGAKYDGTRVGSFGDAACFSFYPTKNLGCYGDGGAIVTDDEELADRLRSLREYGQTEKYNYETVGYNSRLDTIQAAVLSAKLDHLDQWNEDRRAAAARYDTLLESTPLTLPTCRDSVEHVYHLYVVRTRSPDERDELQAHLEDNGVQTGIHYPVPVHEQESYRSCGTQPSLPVTEQVAREIISLPMYPELTPDQQECVKNMIKEFYDGVFTST